MDQRIAIAAGVGGALLVGVLGLSLLKTPPRTAPPVVAVPITAPPIMVAQVFSAELPIKQYDDAEGFVYSTPVLPLYGMEMAGDQRLEWQAVATGKGKSTHITLEFRSYGKRKSGWNELKTKTLILDGDKEQVVQTAKSFTESKRGIGAVTLIVEMEIPAFSTLILSKRPMFVFDGGAVTLDPVDVATCKALIRKAVLASERL